MGCLMVEVLSAGVREWTSPTRSRYVDDTSLTIARQGRAVPAYARCARRSVLGCLPPPPAPRSGDRYGTDVLNQDWRVPKRAARSRSTPTSASWWRRSAATGSARSSRSSRDLGTVPPRGPPPQAAHLPPGPGLPARGPTGRPGRPDPHGTRGADPHRVGLDRGARHQGAGRAGQPDLVEGRHDAELVEKVWGDDLRIEGVVVEYLDGVDDLGEKLRDFAPAPSAGRA